jgi:hypothetical protein
MRVRAIAPEFTWLRCASLVSFVKHQEWSRWTQQPTLERETVLERELDVRRDPKQKISHKNTRLMLGGNCFLCS